MTTYAVDSRYPVPHGNISEEEAAKAMEIARSIFEFVIDALPNLEKLPVLPALEDLPPWPD